ncbi:bacterial transcriptional activator domain-containing protein [Actinomadura sp. ATCC 31491]|uniref:Bacterial transcriptional activator domain-containing protein n=1 Tax=Actinomadura luzonensis TaxID=2805427 RepID=A0ABT0FNV7_9ACTN|nr:bacterial transcriptional activator domain-containing protein [Actinomadura luzonensis]MCK2214032.1 bacterial transcriptional activator domain-containing protein [Actinomadura luzonensis]
MRRQHVRKAIKAMAGLLVAFGSFHSRNRSAHPPTDARLHGVDTAQTVLAPVVPHGDTGPQQAPATTSHVRTDEEYLSAQPALATIRSTAVLHSAGADRRGVIRLIGQCAIEGRGRTAGGWGTDTWALLGLLAEHRSSLLTKSAAGDKLWPDVDAPNDRFAGLLKATRAKMCEAIGMPGNYGRVVIQFVGGTGYRINPDLYTCDVWQIRDLLIAAARAGGSERAAALIAATELYTGSYLSTVPHFWARQAADALNRSIVQALAQLADLEEQPEAEVSYLERATELDGVAEHLYRRRMEVYARLGRLQAVHYCYDELREHLRNRGRKPSPQTEQLYRRISACE